MQAFVVSIFAGILFPLLPLLVEYGVTTHVKLESLTVTAVVYAPAIGLVSRHQAIAISSFFFSIVCAAVYIVGVDQIRDIVPDAPFVTHGPIITIGTLYIFSVCYALERLGRHYVDNEPFLEF
jgi:hypothetical protein